VYGFNNLFIVSIRLVFMGFVGLAVTCWRLKTVRVRKMICLMLLKELFLVKAKRLFFSLDDDLADTECFRLLIYKAGVCVVRNNN
jgi:hypothetical protein